MAIIENVSELARVFRTGDVTEKACGYRLRLVREALPIGNENTRRAFAERIGTNARNLESIENGKSYPRPRFLYAINKTYRVGPRFILFGEWADLPAREMQILAGAASDQPEE